MLLKAIQIPLKKKKTARVNMLVNNIEIFPNKKKTKSFNMIKKYIEIFLETLEIEKALNFCRSIINCFFFGNYKKIIFVWKILFFHSECERILG